MAYPVQRRLTRVSGQFGPREPIPLPGGGWSPNFHGGTDFTPIEKGTPLPVYAVGAGAVIISDRSVERGDRSGIDVAIRLDSDRSIWWYGHLSRADVSVGQRVREGQQLGLMGATGLTASGGRSVTGVHLHLERHYPSLNVDTDPWPYIRDARDVEGLTSSWQTGRPTVPVGDSGAAEEEDDMALTEQQAAALDWLGAEDRRKTFDERLWQIGQLAARIGVIDRLGNSAGATEIADAVAAKLALPGVTAETVRAIAEAVADEQAKRLTD